MNLKHRVQTFYLGDAMVKYLEVTMKNGEVWRVPASIIAMERAIYYIEHDIKSGDVKEEDRDEALDQEYMNGYEDNYNITDWAGNNMNWSDIKDKAIRMPTPPLTDKQYEEDWQNGKRKVIDIKE